MELIQEPIQQMHQKYRGRIAHAEHVAALCHRLFYELQDLHGLPECELVPLLYAAHLHDIGHFIHHKKHHWHSHTLILQDEILDEWEPQLREEVALLALNHRKKKLLLLDDTKGVRLDKMYARLAILRIADALDHEHDQRTRIEQVHVDRQRGQVQVGLSGYEEGAKQRKLLEEKARLAEKTWNVEFRFVKWKEGLGSGMVKRLEESLAETP